MNPLELAARLAIKPNELGLCGGDNKQTMLLHCITSGDYRAFQEKLSSFRDLSAFLNTISAVTGLEQTSYQAIKAYWLGDPVLEQFKSEHYSVLVEQYRALGLPKVFVEDLEKRKPKVFVPTHAFQVLHIGVPGVERMIDPQTAANSCLVRWGELQKINDNNTVLAEAIHFVKGFPEIRRIENVSFQRELIAGLRKGQKVAIHWGSVAMTLTSQEVAELERWTSIVIKSL